MKSQTASELDADMQSISGQLTVVIENALRNCLPLVIEGIGANFDAESDPDGAGWPARVGKDDGHPLLQKSGQLRAAATGGHIAEVIGDTLRVGVDKGGGGGGIPGAAVHNFGFGRVPRREYLGLKGEDLNKCQEQFVDSLMELMK